MMDEGHGGEVTMTDAHELPGTYRDADADALLERIEAARARLGESLVILGHHYQRDEVLRFADHVGDSLKLARQAAGQRDARHIVFCGVHFMAESADVLSGDEQAVYLPNLDAGCAMADMAPAKWVRRAMDDVTARANGQAVPIAYVNSSASTKAIVGAAGGACCTSSNAEEVFRWALSPDGARAETIFCLPDQHLGRNTALAMGYGADDCAVYDPFEPGGGLTDDDLRRATFLLWRGHCHVHQVFTPEQVRDARRSDPDVQVIVHPECPREVVALADLSGSTSKIIREVDAAAAGSHWAVATESELVERLARRNPEKRVTVLSPGRAVCGQMKAIDLPHLAWCLEEIVAGGEPNRITVPRDVPVDARKALERMIALG